MSLARTLLWGRPKSYSVVGLRLVLTLVLAAAIWRVFGAAPAVGGLIVAVLGLLSELRHVRYQGEPPPAWPDATVPPGRPD
jgi:hypothetical protein